MTNYHSDPQEKDWKLARWWRQSLRRTCGGNKQTQSFRFFPRDHYREYSKTLSRHKTGLFSRQNFSAGAHNPERETSFESSGITAFSRARLFLNRFWREFKTSFRSHKPESRVRSRRSDGGERVNSYVGKTRGDFPLVFFFLVNISPTLYDLNAWKRLALSCKNTAKTERGTWVRDERSARSSLSKITLKFYEGIGILFCRLTWYGLRQHL